MFTFKGFTTYSPSQIAADCQDLKRLAADYACARALADAIFEAMMMPRTKSSTSSCQLTHLLTSHNVSTSEPRETLDFQCMKETRMRDSGITQADSALCVVLTATS